MDWPQAARLFDDEERAIPVDENYPPQLIVARSATLEEAIQHRFNPVRSSSLNKVFMELCGRHRQPNFLVLEDCLRIEDRRSQQPSCSTTKMKQHLRAAAEELSSSLA